MDKRLFTLVVGAAMMGGDLLRGMPELSIKDNSPDISRNWIGARQSKDYEFTKTGARRKEKKRNRNSLCFCGSGRKYKNCCIGKK